MARVVKKQFGAFQHDELRNPCQTLLANIRFAGLDEPIKTICVTSSVMDEGKSTVCSNLCVAMASSGKKVLLIDADMRRRSLGKMLGVHPEHGLYALLSGAVSLNEAVLHTEIPNLDFLDNEPNVPNPSDVLSSKRFSALLENLHEIYDYVVLDTPPVGLFVDAAVVANLADGTLLCVRQRSTKRDTVLGSVQQLHAAEANVLGTVMTFTSKSDNDYYYYYYYNEETKRRRKGEASVASVEPTLAKAAEIAADEDIKDWAIHAGLSPVRPTRNGGAAENPASRPQGNYAPGGFKTGK